MRGFALPLLLGTLLAAGTLPAVAQPTQIAAPVMAETPYRQTYEQDARTRLRVWGRELADFNKAAEAKGKGLDDEAGAELNTAWIATKAEERNLEVASTDQWESSRTTFDHASRRFEDALDRARSHLD
jgi:hypothetical protein